MPELSYWEKQHTMLAEDYPERWSRRAKYKAVSGDPGGNLEKLQHLIDKTAAGDYEGVTTGIVGGTARLSEGTIYVDDEVQLKEGVYLTGAGRRATILKADNTMAQGKFVVVVDNVTYADAETRIDRWAIRDLCIHGNRSFKHAYGGIRVQPGDNTNDMFEQNPDMDAYIENVIICKTGREGIKLMPPSSFDSLRSIHLRDIYVMYCGNIGIWTRAGDSDATGIYVWTGSDYGTFTESGNTITITGGPIGGPDFANSSIVDTTTFGSTLSTRGAYLIGLDNSSVIVCARAITANSHDGSGNPTITYSGTAGSFATASATRVEVNCAHGIFINGAPNNFHEVECANIRGIGFADRASRNMHTGVTCVDTNGDGIFVGNTATIVPYLTSDNNRRNMAVGNGGLTDVSGFFCNAAGTIGVGHHEDWNTTDGHTVNALRVNGTIAAQHFKICVVKTITTPALIQGTPGAASDVFIFYHDGSDYYRKVNAEKGASLVQAHAQITSDATTLVIPDGAQTLTVTLDTAHTLSSNPQIAAGYQGQRIKILNVDGAGDVLTLANGNGLRLPGATNLALGQYDSITLEYNTTAAVWVADRSVNV